MRLKLVIGAGGELALPGREVAAAGLSPEAGVEWSALPGLGVAAPPGGGAWIAGNLGAASFAEVAQLVASGLHSGALHLALPGDPAPQRKTIFFRDGQVVSASSSDPADRLGPVLVRTGRVEAAAVERWSGSIAPGRPLGQILVEQRVLTAGQLYEGLADQVMEIFLSAFEAPAGDFVFRQEAPDERNAVKLPVRTRDLILQGLKRAEAVEAAARTPAPAGRAGGPMPQTTTLALTPNPLLAGSGAGRTSAAPAGPRHPARAATPPAPAPVPAAPADARGAGEGRRPAGAAPPAADFEAAAAPAPGSGTPTWPAIPAATVSSAPAPVPRGPFEAYRRLLKAIHEPVLRAVPDARRRLDSWFERLPAAQAAFFEGVHFDATGDLDVLRVLANVERGGIYRGPAARAKALEALEGLLAFALFEAKNLLPREAAEALRREVHRIQMGG